MIKNLAARITRNQPAFTLVELLVVITIIVLLVGILLPSVGGCNYPVTKSRADRSNLHQIGITVQGYAAKNDDHIPLHPRYLAAFFHESVSQRDIFISPYQDEDAVLDRGEASGIGFRYGGYVFVELGASMLDMDAPSKTIVVYTAKVSSKQVKRNVLFVDGHAEQLEEEAFLAMLPDGMDVDALDGP